jgi:outer membrane receptor for ferrienterochelin and colicins
VLIDGNLVVQFYLTYYQCFTMKRYFFAAIFFIALASSSEAQTKTDANIFGHTVFRGEHLSGIHVYIKGTQIGTVTDRTGHYFLFNLPTGRHTIVASGIGYKISEVEVDITANTTLEVDFELESEVHTVKEVVVTASRMEQNKKDAPVVVNIISPKLLQSTNSLTISDALGFQSGLRVENNCQNCGFQQVRINGLEGTYSQILIDGRPVFSALAGVYGLEHIPSAMIDRIEIVKGAGSATYGSNAIGGTINVITRDPLYNSYEIGHNISALNKNVFDNNSFFNTTVLSNGNSGGVSIFGNLRNRQAYDHDGDGFTEIPLSRVNSIGFKAFHRMNSRSKITAEYHNVSDFRRGGNKLNRMPHQTDITEQLAHQIHSGSAVYERLFRDNKGRFNVFSSYRLTNRDSYYGAGEDLNAYGTSEDKVSYTGFEYLRFFHGKFLPKSFLIGGDYTLNALKDRQIAYNRLISQTTQNYALFSQAQWNAGMFSFLAGVRGDKHNFVDNIILSPRLNLLVSPSEYLQARVGFATGFRAPQAFDEDLHIMAVGGEVQLIELDEDLKTETSQSFTLSFDWSPKFARNKINFIAEGFLTKLNDVFVLESAGTDSSGNLIMVRTNGECASVAGVNLEMKYIPHADFDVQLGFTYQNSIYAEPLQWSDDPAAEETSRMLRTPDQYGYISTSWKSKKDIFFSVSGIYTGSMLVPRYAGYIENDKLETTESFFDMNVKIAKIFKLPRYVNLELAAGVKNIFNQYQKEFDQGPDRDAGYIYGPMYPRQIFLSLRFGNFL